MAYGQGFVGQMKTVTAAMRKNAADRARTIAKHNYPYVFAEAGPDSYDCSGLIVAAWAPEGVTIRHNTGWMAEDFGVHEPTQKNLHKLKPGDVVTYYGSWKWPESIGHVAMFVGPWTDPVSHDTVNMVAQATDEAHGTEMIYMKKYAHPSGFLFVGHS